MSVSLQQLQSKIPFYFHIAFKINGFWPTDGDENSFIYRILYRMYSLWNLTIICGVFGLVLSALAYTLQDNLSLSEAVQNLCISLTSSLVFLRMCHMRYSDQSLRKIILSFQNTIWIRQEAYPSVFAQCIRRMKPIMYMGISIVLMTLAYLLTPVGFYISNGQTLQSPDKHLSYNMYLPYDVQKPTNFILTTMGTYVFGLTGATTIYAMDCLMSFFVSFLCGQFEILHGEIDRLIPECHTEWKSEITTTNGRELWQLHAKYENRLQELIVRHNDLIKFSDELKVYYSFPLSVIFATATLQIGFGGFQFLINGLSSFSEFMRFFLYFLTVTGQLFVICKLGNILIIRSLETATYLFHCNWEGGRISKDATVFLQEDNENLEALFKKSPMWPYVHYHPSERGFQQKINFMAMRSQRSLHLSAMNYVPLSLETFTRVNLLAIAIKMSLSQINSLSALVPIYDACDTIYKKLRHGPKQSSTPVASLLDVLGRSNTFCTQNISEYLQIEDSNTWWDNPSGELLLHND
ncbi:odorant receptor 13a-like [Haematobia irritans]|uniref:odorant receptor 13a-like n=1 Tax=Haematobia irritans TaxID=7368 RepID=UPI003F4F78A0